MKLALTFLLLGIQFAHAQVRNSAFELMLSGLLDSKMPIVQVNEAIKMNALFLDAREKEEFEISHIKNAHWIGFETFSLNSLPELQKNDTIIVYCSIGYRSEVIGKILIEEGYAHVFNLYGGIFEWVNSDQFICDSEDNPSNRIHAYDRFWGIWLDKGEKVYY